MLAASPLSLQVTDDRGKKPGGIVVDATDPDADGWYKLAIAKSKNDAVAGVAFRCPRDEARWAGAGQCDCGGQRRCEDTAIDASGGHARGTGVARGASLNVVAASAGLDAGAMGKAVEALAKSDDGFEKGIALLWAKKPADAKDELVRGLRARERVMTRIPSDMYPAAMLLGKAQFDAGKFDDAAVTYLKAVKLRPTDMAARRKRAVALEKAGKPEAAEESLRKR